jgi:hypothetical protein
MTQTSWNVEQSWKPNRTSGKSKRNFKEAFFASCVGYGSYGASKSADIKKAATAHLPAWIS